MQPQQPMQMHEKPGMPRVKVGIDLFEVDGFNFLIISRYFSWYPVIKQPTSTTSSSIIAVTKETFALLGVPREVISDNGPQYQSAYNFCEEWGIKHTTTSPLHVQSNGYIECQIHYLKSIIKKCIKSDGDVSLVLLNVRATPLDINFQVQLNWCLDALSPPDCQATLASWPLKSTEITCIKSRINKGLCWSTHQRTSTTSAWKTNSNPGQNSKDLVCRQSCGQELW